MNHAAFWNLAIANTPPSSRRSHISCASLVLTLVTAGLAVAPVCRAGRHETLVLPVEAAIGHASPPRVSFEPPWPRTRLGYVTDSVAMQLIYHPEIGFGHAEPRAWTRIRSGTPVDSVDIHVGHRASTRQVQYEVCILSAHGAPVPRAVAEIRLTSGHEPPRRALERWSRDRHGFDSTPRHPDWEQDSAWAAADTTLKPDPPLYRWATFSRDTMVVHVEIDAAAMNRSVWLPAACRWTVDGDETARYTVAVAFYWIREAHLHHRIPRRPDKSANERAWRYAERLLNARLLGQ